MAVPYHLISPEAACFGKTRCPFFLRKGRVKEYPSQTTLLKATSPHDPSELTHASRPNLAEARLVRQA